MKLYDVVILTDAEHAYPNKINEYTKNVLVEDGLVLNALGKIGLKAIRLSWDNPNFDWSSTKAVLFRTTWDYFYRFQEFSNWLNRISKQTQLLNSEAIIRWNLDKHYLTDLQKANVNIAETHFIEKGTQTTLSKLHSELHWEETVLKPCVSGTARHTYKLNTSNLSEYETIFQELINHEGMMLQPFQKSIVTKGEISLVLFNGNFTHAVIKTAKKGDFRVQDDFGGMVQIYNPTQEEITFAENAVKACFELPIYARVDIFTDNQGNLAIAELELIEPELWFRFNPNAAHVLAESISKKII